MIKDVFQFNSVWMFNDLTKEKSMETTEDSSIVSVATVSF